MLLTLLCACFACNTPSNQQPLTDTTMTIQDSTQTDSAVFAGGCFWCLDAVYRNLQGVTDVVSGYSNGHTENPNYKEVCTGNTGYAEVVKIHFDPEKVGYADLLEIFWRIHDPTHLNRQGNDVGTQYRSGIYYLNDEQKLTAEASLQALIQAEVYNDPIVTEILPLQNWYPAEDYHQDYFRQNPQNPYCNYVVGEKVEKFKKLFREKLRETPLIR
jgi:peptide-methionine (S)-S-oxide reductase